MQKFNDEMLNALPDKISKLYERLNSERSGQLADINTVKSHIYNTSAGEHGFMLPDIYEQAQTLKAHILESLSSHPEGLFDVFPGDLKYSENAKKQKIMLVSALENMKMTDKLDSIVNDLVECGESIVFIGWKKIYKKIRKAVTEGDKIAFIADDKLVYDGPVLRRIAPEDFVFDVKADFENAAKIFRYKALPHEVFEDKNNNCLTNLIKDELYNWANHNHAIFYKIASCQSFITKLF